MFARISKHQFIDALTSFRNCLIYCGIGDVDLSQFETMCFDGFDCDRVVTAVRSNHVEFSDGSRLYFDGYATRTYYVHGDLLAVTIKERGCPLPKTLVYLTAPFHSWDCDVAKEGV